MVKSVSQHQRGFTLIEMSIVLVIIGLIIGGILKGQELIESSRQKNMISQLDRLKAGTTTFVDRFKSLPGDFNRVALLQGGGATAGGNDNGVIGTESSNISELLNMSASTTLANEEVQYFNQLLAANLSSGGSVTSGVTLACFSSLCATASPLPPSAFPQSGLTLHYGTHEGGASPYADSKQVHWLVLSRFTTGTLSGTTGAVISPERAYQLDSKYDDGVAMTGNIRTGLVGTGCGSSGTDYDPALTNVSCHLMFSLE